ncbi:MAG TPA: hypothetical protein DD490_05645 [Acidobacteria bacterium]|nr:hypothetical protein [Acidobacteriota bacterium]
MMDKNVEAHDANRDPISGAPGAHPLGTGVGAAGGGVTGATIGAVVGGPVGAVVGAAVGAIAGGLAGKGVAEEVNPTVEDGYWRENFAGRPYAAKDAPYDQYAPAYKYGWESQSLNAGKKFEDVSNDLEHGWDTAKGTSSLPWSHAKSAVSDAWHRVEKAMPGDADRDGR